MLAQPRPQRTSFPPVLKAVHELEAAGIALRRFQPRQRATRRPAPRLSPRRQANIPALTAEVESASLVAGIRARGAPDRQRLRADLLLEDVEALQSSKAPVVDACRYGRALAGVAQVVARKPSGAARARTGAGRSVARRRSGGRSACARISERNSWTNRTARGYVSKSGGRAECFGHSPRYMRQRADFNWRHAVQDRSSYLHGPSKVSMGRCLPFSPTVKPGRARPWACWHWAPGQRSTVQRALDSLAGRRQSAGAWRRPGSPLDGPRPCRDLR